MPASALSGLTDVGGNVHFIQFSREIPVFGGELVVDLLGDSVHAAMGDLLSGLALDTVSGISDPTTPSRRSARRWARPRLACWAALSGCRTGRSPGWPHRRHPAKPRRRRPQVALQATALRDTILEGQSAPVFGRNQAGTWIKIAPPDQAVECWIFVELVELSVLLEDLPVLLSPPTPTRPAETGRQHHHRGVRLVTEFGG